MHLSVWLDRLRALDRRPLRLLSGRYERHVGRRERRRLELRLALCPAANYALVRVYTIRESS